LISSADYLDPIREARLGAKDLKQIILIEETVPQDVLSLLALIQNFPSELAIEETDNDDAAVMIYTPGPPEIPKG